MVNSLFNYFISVKLWQADYIKFNKISLDYSFKLKTRKSILIFYNNWYNDLKYLKQICEITFLLLKLINLEVTWIECDLKINYYGTPRKICTPR